MIDKILSNFEISIGDCYFKLVAHKTDKRGRIKSTRDVTGWFKNDITNNGMNSLSGSFTPAAWACIGSGTTPVNITDTGLASFITNTQSKPQATTYVNTNVAPFYVEGQFFYRFPAVGVSRNVSEVGLQTSAASSNTNGNLFSRALVRDSQGNPITISVAAGEILDVNYRYRLYPPQTDTTQNLNFVIAGVPTPFVLTHRAVSMGGFYWRLDLAAQFNFLPRSGFAKNGPMDALLSNGVTTGAQFANFGTISSTPYVANSYQIDATFTVDTTAGNGINFNTFNFIYGTGPSNTGMAFQFTINGTVSKNSSQRLRIINRITWARL